MLHTFIEQAGLSTQSNLFEEVVGYLCRLHGTKIKTYHQRFEAACEFGGELSPSSFRYSLYTQRDIGLSLKYYAMYAAFNYNPRHHHALCASGASFNITVRDARRVLRLLSDASVRSRVLAACAASSITRDMVSHSAYLKVIAQGHGMINGLRESIAKHVNKQLAWVARAHNVRTSDLHTDVTSELLMVYYAMVPTCRSPEHIHGYLCSALHSRIKNLQNKHGSQKRARMVQVTEHGESRYQLLETNESHLNKNCSAGEEIGLESLASADDSQVIHDFEFQRSVDTLLSRVRRGTKRYALYCVLLGRSVSEFGDYLRKRRLLRSTNKTASEWLIGKPIDYVAEVLGAWLGASPVSVKRGMDDIATCLL